MTAPNSNPTRRDDQQITVEAFYDGHITAAQLSHGHFVYLIRSGDTYKIGKSSDPEARFRALLTGSPNELMIEAVLHVENMHRVESFLHQHFAAQHVRGEWFRLTDDDVIFIRSLNEAKLTELGLTTPEDEFPF